MQLTIKNPAPDDATQTQWGDFHFGNSLQRSFESRGVTVFQDFMPNWSMDHGEDVVLVLHGLSKFQPSKTKYNILWIISHPAMITAEELNTYDFILTASAFHCTLLRGITKTPVEVARQCTDDNVFYPPGLSLSEEAKIREGIVYVANSRGQRRDMAQWIAETDTPVRVFGRAWEKFGIGHLVEKEYLPNADLPELYRSAGLGLNDHWKDMRAFGFISNRVFDSLACGLPLLTDSFPEIRTLLGDTLLYAQNAEEFREKITFCRSNYEEVLGRVRESWNELSRSYTFDARADELIHWIQNPPKRTAKPRSRDSRISRDDCIYDALREFIVQEEEKTKSLETLISDRTRLADQARREAIWAKKQKEEEKRLREDFHRKAEKARQEIKHLTERISAQEKAKNKLHDELQAARGQLSDLQTHLEKEKTIRTHLVWYAETLRNQLEAIYNSRSWKIGAPYRIVARTVHGLLKDKKIGKARIPDWPAAFIQLNENHNDFQKVPETENSPIDAPQIPTGSFQNPIFADQIFGPSNAEKESGFRHSQLHISPHLRRLPSRKRYQIEQILLTVRRRLPDWSKRALKGLLVLMRIKKPDNALQQGSERSVGEIEAGFPHSDQDAQRQPVSLEVSPEIKEGIDYWYNRAMQFLKELEAIQGEDRQIHMLKPKRIRKIQITHKDDALTSSDEDTGNDRQEWTYWRAQALQLHEELEYAKTNLKKRK